MNLPDREENTKESSDVLLEGIKNIPPLSTTEQKDIARKKLEEFNITIGKTTATIKIM